MRSFTCRGFRVKHVGQEDVVDALLDQVYEWPWATFTGKQGCAIGEFVASGGDRAISRR